MHTHITHTHTGTHSHTHLVRHTELAPGGAVLRPGGSVSLGWVGSDGSEMVREGRGCGEEPSRR